MVQNTSRYSQSQGLKLLEAALQEFGPILTIGQLKPIAQAQGLSDTHTGTIINLLADAGWIEIIKRGTYAVRSPLYSGEIPAFAIAAALVQPMAVSHWSACAHHGFTTQVPAMVQASTPRKVVTPQMRKGKADSPRGRAVWRAGGYEIEFIHVNRRQFWGLEKIWVSSWGQADITDPERTALDLIARPDIFGGISAGIEILENALSHIQVNRLADYALKHDTGAVIKRLGWALEQLGVSDQELERLQSYPVKRYYALDPGLDHAAPKNARWRVVENIRRS